MDETTLIWTNLTFKMWKKKNRRLSCVSQTGQFCKAIKETGKNIAIFSFLFI